MRVSVCVLGYFLNYDLVTQGRSQDFSKGGSHCVECLKKGLFSDGQDIVMAFSPSVVGSLVKKGLQKGGSRAPPGPPPAYALVTVFVCLRKRDRETFHDL